MSVLQKSDLVNYSLQNHPFAQQGEPVMSHEEHFKRSLRDIARSLVVKYKLRKPDDKSKCVLVWWFSPYLYKCELPSNPKEYYLQRFMEAFPDCKIDIKEYKPYDYNVSFDMSD